MESNTPIHSFRSEFFEHSEMLISIYDKHLNLLDANQSFLNSLKLNLPDITGKNISEISPDCKPSGRYELYQQVIKTGKPVVIDQLQLHPSLGGMYLRLHAFKLGDGLGISSKDITDLIETIEDLETFIKKTSHDIRSPITTTLGLINVAKNDLKQHQLAIGYLDMIQKQTEQLDQIMIKLVETTKIRRGDHLPDLIDFEQELDHIIHSLENMPGFKQMTFEKHIHLKELFYTDKTLLLVVFQNLIQNAIKYRNESNAVSVLSITISSEGKGIKILMKDNGIGISDYLQKDVFKMFFRGTNRTSGIGLGLYTVKHCVKKLEGQIFLESRSGVGTIFTILIPNLQHD